MKKVFLLLIVFGAAILLVVKPIVYTNSSQPPTFTTGAPGEPNCGQCHSGVTATGTVSINFNSGNTSYEFDSTYAIDLTINHPAATRFGFSLTALDTNNAEAGDLIVLNSANTSLQSTATRQYIGHKSAGSSNTWSFAWKAPAASSSTSSVTFYYSANAANNNNAVSGDATYKGSLTIALSPAGVSLLPPTSAPEMYYDRQTGSIQLFFYSRKSDPLNVYLFSVDGKYSREFNSTLSTGKNSMSFSIGELVPGMYICKIICGKQIFSQKMVIQ